MILLLAWLVQLGQGRNVWDTWVASHELRKPNYTEAIHAADLFRTRANTWSNLAYIFVGLYAIAFGLFDGCSKPRESGGYLSRTPAMSCLFGIACCTLGIGSGVFHASLTRWGQQLDVGAMYAPLLMCIAINVGRYVPTLRLPGKPQPVKTWPALALVALTISFLLYYFKWSMSSAQVLPVHILIVAAFALIDWIPPRRAVTEFLWLVAAAGSLALAIYCRQLDVLGRFSSPDSWLQGHAVWHLLTAITLGSMYLYYRAEPIAIAKPIH